MSVKDINIKNCTYYFFDDIINMRDSDTNNTKIDEKWYKNIFFTIMDIKPKYLYCKFIVIYFWESEWIFWRN